MGEVIKYEISVVSSAVYKNKVLLLESLLNERDPEISLDVQGWKI